MIEKPKPPKDIVTHYGFFGQRTYDPNKGGKQPRWYRRYLNSELTADNKTLLDHHKEHHRLLEKAETKLAMLKAENGNTLHSLAVVSQELQEAKAALAELQTRKRECETCRRADTEEMWDLPGYVWCKQLNTAWPKEGFCSMWLSDRRELMREQEK